MNFFRPLHEYFLGLIGVHEFFHLIFPDANIFFVLPPPNKFSNGPSLMSLRQNGFRNLANWLPGLTRHRLKIARHHRILHGRGSVVSAVSSRRMYSFCFGNCLISNVLTKKTKIMFVSIHEK